MVVYVDDEAVLCRIFARIFERHSIEVTTFSDAHEALEFLRSNDTVKVIVCDYRMPRMNGLELVEQLERRIPTYILSGDLGVVNELQDHPRIDAVLPKPIKPEVLVEAVRKHLPG